MTERTRAIKQYNRRAAAGLHDGPYCGCVSGLVDKLAVTIKHSEDLWYKDGCLDGQDDARRKQATEQLTIAFRGRIRFSAGIELHRRRDLWNYCHQESRRTCRQYADFL